MEYPHSLLRVPPNNGEKVYPQRPTPTYSQHSRVNKTTTPNYVRKSFLLHSCSSVPELRAQPHHEKPSSSPQQWRERTSRTCPRHFTHECTAHSYFRQCATSERALPTSSFTDTNAHPLTYPAPRPDRWTVPDWPSTATDHRESTELTAPRPPRSRSTESRRAGWRAWGFARGEPPSGMRNYARCPTGCRVSRRIYRRTRSGPNGRSGRSRRWQRNRGGWIGKELGRGSAWPEVRSHCASREVRRAWRSPSSFRRTPRVCRDVQLARVFWFRGDFAVRAVAAVGSEGRSAICAGNLRVARTRLPSFFFSLGPSCFSQQMPLFVHLFPCFLWLSELLLFLIFCSWACVGTLHFVWSLLIRCWTYLLAVFFLRFFYVWRCQLLRICYTTEDLWVSSVPWRFADLGTCLFTTVLFFYSAVSSWLLRWSMRLPFYVFCSWIEFPSFGLFSSVFLFLFTDLLQLLLPLVLPISYPPTLNYKCRVYSFTS